MLKRFFVFYTMLGFKFLIFAVPPNGMEQVNNRFVPRLENTVKFDDVRGLDEVKEEVYEIVDFLKNPQKYREKGQLDRRDRRYYCSGLCL